MKTIRWQGMAVLFGMLLILTVDSGPVLGSENETNKAKGYESHEKYENEFYGTIEKLPAGLIGIWTVSGKQVEVTTNTYIEEEYGKAKIGTYVEVKGKKEGEIFKAHKIETKRAKK